MVVSFEFIGARGLFFGKNIAATNEHELTGSAPKKLVENRSRTASYEAGIYRIAATGIIIREPLIIRYS